MKEFDRIYSKKPFGIARWCEVFVTNFILRSYTEEGSELIKSTCLEF